MVEYSVYQLLWLFLIYAFLGWCCEIGFCGIEEGHFVNRGFMSGPWCPIYGFGGVLIVVCLTPIENNYVLLFLGAMLLCSAIELVTGWAMEKIYHTRWWDYSDKKFNIGGYICLQFSILWGCFGIFLMKLLHPFVFGIVRHLSNVIGISVLIFLGAVFVADLVITLLTAKNMIDRIKKADELAEKIKDVTEKIARNIYTMAVRLDTAGKEIYNNEDVQEFIEKTQTVNRVRQKRIDWQIAEFRAAHEDELEEFAERVEAIKKKYKELENEHDEDINELKEKLSALKEKYGSTINKKNIFQKRMLNAFPHMKDKKHQETLKKLRETQTKKKDKELKNYK